LWNVIMFNMQANPDSEHKNLVIDVCARVQQYVYLKLYILCLLMQETMDRCFN
jgi:hypothetical protein